MDTTTTTTIQTPLIASEDTSSNAIHQTPTFSASQIANSDVLTIASEDTPVTETDNKVTLKDNKQTTDNDTNVLSGDNKVDVDIEPDVKDNITRIQLCSCTFIWNCFTNQSVAKN
jgi:hypothetical protein